MFLDLININSNGDITAKDGTGSTVVLSRGGQSYSPVQYRVAVNADYLTNGENLIGVTNTAVPRTITLSTVDTTAPGRVIEIIDESFNASVNNISIVIQGGAAFANGGLTKTINSNGGSKKFYSNGSTWVELVSFERPLDMQNLAINNISTLTSTTTSQTWTALFNRGAVPSKTRFNSLNAEALGDPVFEFANNDRIFASLLAGDNASPSVFKTGRLTLGKLHTGASYQGIIDTADEDLYINSGPAGTRNTILHALNNFVFVDPQTTGSNGRFVVGKNSTVAISRPDPKELFVVQEDGQTFIKNTLENLDAAAFHLKSQGTAGTGGFILQTLNTFGSADHTVFRNGITDFCIFRPDYFAHTGTGLSSLGGTLNIVNTPNNLVALDMNYGIIRGQGNPFGIQQSNGGLIVFSRDDWSLGKHDIRVEDNSSLTIYGFLDNSSNRQLARIRSYTSSGITNGAFQLWHQFNLPTGNKLLQILKDNGSKTALELDADGTLFGQDLANGGGTNNPFKFTSKEQDNATANAFVFNTINTIDTNGSTLFSVRNAGDKVVDIRKNDDFLGTDSNILNIYDNANNVSFQFSGDQQGLLARENGSFYIITTSDYTYNSPYNTGEIGVNPADISFTTDFEQTYQASGIIQGTNTGSKAVFGANTAFMEIQHPDIGLEYFKATTLDTELKLKQVDMSNPDNPILELRESGDLKFAVTQNGGLVVKRTPVVANVNSSQETIIGVTDTSSAVTITLLTDDCAMGRIIVVKDETGGAATNNITIDTQGAETIDGAATYVISTDYGVARFYSNGTDWYLF